MRPGEASLSRPAGSRPATASAPSAPSPSRSTGSRRERRQSRRPHGSARRPRRAALAMSLEAVRAVHARRGVDQPPPGARDAPSGRHGSDGALAARPRGPRQRSRERRRHGSTGPGRRRKALSAARRGLDGASFAATHLRSRAIDAGKPGAQRMSAQAEIGARATRSRPRCTCQP